MKRNYVWAAALLMLAACSNEEVLTTIDNPDRGNEGQRVTVTATLPGNDSRVTLEDVTENGKNIIKVAWDDNATETFTAMTTEPFSVKSEEDDVKYLFTRTGGNNFTGTLPESVEGQPYYAVYPALDMWTVDESYEEGGRYNYWDPIEACYITSLQASQVPFNIFNQDGTLEAAKPLMYATSTDGSSFDFHHLTAIVKFTLTGLPTTITGKELNFLISWQSGCQTEGVLDLTQSTVADMYPGSSGGSVQVSSTPNNGTATFYAYLPPVVQGDKLSITAQCYDEDNVYLLSAEVELTDKGIEAGKYYRATREVTTTTTTISRNMTADNVQELKAWLEAFQEYGGINLTLTNDITLTDADDLDGDPENNSNWPVRLDLFDTTIDGGGHTLTGLKMDVTGEGEFAAMFHRIDETSAVKNLHLRDVQLSSSMYNVAGVVADNYGTVSGCSVSGTISSDADGYNAGGVVGYNSGTVTACYSTGAVSATGESAYAGGVVGGNDIDATVTACYWNDTRAESGIGYDYKLGELSNEGTTRVDGSIVTWISDALTVLNEALREIEDFGWLYIANENTDTKADFPLVLESTSSN